MFGELWAYIKPFIEEANELNCDARAMLYELIAKYELQGTDFKFVFACLLRELHFLTSASTVRELKHLEAEIIEANVEWLDPIRVFDRLE